MEAFTNAINQYRQGEIDKLPETLKEILTNTKPIPEAVDRVGDELREMGDDVKSATDAANEMDNLKRQVMDFFSITNSIQLFKRAITSALNTVKELDATMTEAAVVTEFDVSDMWEKLPQYSKEAQNLGVSINGMYQATTLYYQQGLKNQEAMELGIETMKMGKIAAMDSTEATKAMTAALRGFNMELNETSATRVNDVYSQLAAVTAADTNQIATAMEKTASIAASANIEFETTAAFLAQIIETTQEAPETAGTALKTIIARFAEVKSLRDQGLTSGEDEEGEIIDVNKIQTALRSVGISMEGFFSGKEGLDSVLLKLAEKWGTLDFETQRYIATMAAGSRQQSRFIAMMSDYSRTTELVGEAQNSAGASQKQFEKTQDSLATSLTRLKNAWDQFLMGLANNEILKAGIDGLTKILETVNKITDGISGGNGLIKSVVSLAGVLATLKGGKALLSGTAVSGAMSGLVGKLVGDKGGEVANKSSYFGLPSGVDPGKGWSKEEWQRGKKAKQAQMAANRPSLKQNFTKKIKEDYSKVSKNLGKMEMGLSQDDISARAMGIRKLNEELAEGIITEKEAADGYVKLGGSLDELEAKTAKTIPDFDAIGQAANTAGMAMMAAGAATSLLASAFESWGMEEEAEAMQTLSGVLMTLGPILMGIGSFLPVLTGLTAAQAAATWAALWPILLVVAALGALVVAIVLASKAAHESSLEGRMEAAAEATERAKEAAEGAKQAYDELLSAKSGYDELQTKLDTLTKGTLEWKQALADSNAQVLELLDKYPELAKYLTRGKNGELEVTEAGWDYIEEQQQQAVQNTNAAVVASQMDETRLKREKAEQDLQKKFKDRFSGNDESNVYLRDPNESDYATYEANTLEAMLKLYRENPDVFKKDGNNYSTALEAIAKESDYTAEELWNMKDALAQYDTALAENETMLQAQAEALLTNAASAETNAYEYGDEIITGFAQGIVKNQEKNEQAIQKELAVGSGESVKDTDKFQEMASAAGIQDIELTGDNVHDLEVLYAKMAGISTEEIADGLKGKQEKLIEEISKMQVAKDTGVQVDSVYQAMSKLDEDAQRKYAILVSKNVSNANQEFIDDFSSLKTIEELETMAKKLGFENATKMAESFGYEGDIEKMQTGFVKIAKTTQEKFEEVNEALVRYKIELDKEYLDKLTLAQRQSYAELLMYADSLGTKDVIQEGLNQILAAANDEQKAKISSFMEATDWSQDKAGEDFLKFLKTIGINIEKIIPKANNFSTAIKTVDAAFKSFDVNSIMEQIQGQIEDIEEIAENNSLSNEQYSKYLDEGLIKVPEEWFWNGKEWVSKTESGMSNLVDALKSNTEALIGTTKQEAQGQIDFYNESKKQVEAYLSNFKDLKHAGENPISREDVYSGKATREQQISLGFNTQKEYDRFLELEGGGLSETQKILALMNSFRMPTITIGGGSKKEKWENPYDKLHNSLEEINDLLRERERLERRYQRLVESGTGTYKDFKKSQEGNIANYENEIGKQEFVRNQRNKELDDLIAKNPEMAKYITFEEDENGDRTIRIDWDAINAVTDEKKGTAIEEFYDEAKTILDSIYDAETAQEEALDAIYEELQTGKDEYFNLEEQTKEALVNKYQAQIDEMSNVNDSINDTNSRILDAMQQQIDDARQERDNAKTEEEIADKQQRLAYLSMDTSGANQLEILQLQDEIDQAQEDYTDTLIDQKISELQRQNDEAAEQRQHQIDIAQAQLDQWVESGAVWDEVESLISGALNADGSIKPDSELMNVLRQGADFKSMSEIQQMDWLKETNNMINQGLVWLTGQGAMTAYYQGKEIEFTTADGQAVKGTVQADGSVVTADGKTYKNVTRGIDGTFSTDENYQASNSNDNENKEEPSIPEVTEADKKGVAAAIWNGGQGWGSGSDRVSKLAEVFGENNDIQSNYVNKKNYAGTPSDYSYEKMKKKFVAYKTGGLADFTGPAWLDGTKSKPEYILNADQTRAFFQLVDVLGSLQSGNTKTTQNNGDNTYDIDINVESIGSDYDVEQLAETVKRMINEDARYRNNNTAGSSR